VVPQSGNHVCRGLANHPGHKPAIFFNCQAAEHSPSVVLMR